MLYACLHVHTLALATYLNFLFNLCENSVDFVAHFISIITAEAHWRFELDNILMWTVST